MSAASSLLGSSGTTNAGSPLCSVILPASSSPAAIRLTSPAKLDSDTRSRISRPIRESLPTTARCGVLANLVLRMTGRSVPHVPSNTSANTNHDTAGYIGAGAGSQHGLRVIPNQVNQAAQKNHGQRRSRAQQINILETVIPPGADHQKREQHQQQLPRDTKHPGGDRH